MKDLIKENSALIAELLGEANIDKKSIELLSKAKKLGRKMGETNMNVGYDEKPKKGEPRLFINYNIEMGKGVTSRDHLAEEILRLSEGDHTFIVGLKDCENNEMYINNITENLSVYFNNPDHLHKDKD